MQCKFSLISPSIRLTFLRNPNNVGQGSASKFGIGPKNYLPLDSGLEHSQTIISDLLKHWCANIVSIIIAAFCGANLVYGENNYVFVSYFTYGLMHFLQISANSKSDTD